MKPTQLYFIFLFSITTVTSVAQKLPNVQTASLRAPANIKIDGKANEWNTQFQAYNKATDVFYTIANDDKKLYLVIKAVNEGIIKKIVMGGVTFAITTNNKQDIKNPQAITFPVYDINYPPSYFTFNKSTTLSDSNIDSLTAVYNKALSAKYKLIKISGIEGIDDGLSSVYNNVGVTAAAQFDNQLNYIYEMALPLKYIKLGADSKITYNIKINAATIDGRKLETLPGRNIVVYTGADGVTYTFGNDPQGMLLVAPTDFWSKYTLTK